MKSNLLLEDIHRSNDISQEIVVNGFTCIKGKKLQTELNLSASQVKTFQGYWEDLKLDMYMNDGGNYRYRRYSQLNRLSQDPIFKLLPHEPYSQPSYINTLNGNVLRKFEPMGKDFIECTALNKILYFIQCSIDEIEGNRLSWNIRLHPYRILANSESPGLPTPEGLHRDGVDYICTLMLNRINITGGATTITDLNKSPIKKLTLEDPLDLVIANDNLTMHDVSPIIPTTNSCNGYRDVLVIAFTLI